MKKLYKFTSDYKTKNEVEYFLLKEMDEFNGRIGELLDSGMLRFMRSDSHFKEFDFKSIPDRWLDLVEEKEQSPAKKWLERVVMYHKISINQKETVDKWAIPAHEAGQKHGGDVERGRYTELVELCRYMARHYNVIFAQAKSSMTLNKLKTALKNLEENEPVSEEAEPAKNYKEIKDSIFAYLENAKGDYLGPGQRDTAMIVFETLRHLKLI